jgi:hypothetical protein
MHEDSHPVANLHRIAIVLKSAERKAASCSLIKVISTNLHGRQQISHPRQETPQSSCGDGDRELDPNLFVSLGVLWIYPESMTSSCSPHNSCHHVQ